MCFAFRYIVKVYVMVWCVHSIDFMLELLILACSDMNGEMLAWFCVWG